MGGGGKGEERKMQNMHEQTVIESVCDRRWGVGEAVDQWVKPRLNWDDSGGRNTLGPL